MIKWSPFDDLNVLQDQLNQFLEDPYVRRFMPERRMREAAQTTGQTWTPPVEAWESENELFISMDMPGITIQDIDLQIEGDQLIIKGERKAPEEKKSYRRREKIYGPFYRAFSLTTPFDRERVSASYKNGMLEIVLPKSEAIKPKQIKIAVEE